MKILYIGKSQFDNATGGEISAKLLVERLSLNHSVMALSLGEDNHDIKGNIRHRIIKAPLMLKKRWLPYHLREYLRDVYFENKIKALLKTITPDMVICQCIAINPVIFSKKVKSIYFIRSCEDYGLSEGCDIPERPYSRWYNFPFVKVRKRKGVRVLKNADLLISNSLFMKQYLLKKDLSSVVVYPFINLDQYRYKEPKKHDQSKKSYITFINPFPKKGVRIALAIAKTLPGKVFLFVGRSKNIPLKILAEIKSLKNVMLIEWVQDMREVYRKTRVVIMPSIWAEAFGRIPIEAGINGIPTIASNRGGTRESVGKEGLIIEDLYNINHWIEAIKALDQQEQYDKYADYVRENARHFNFEHTYNAFKTRVREKLKITL